MAIYLLILVAMVGLMFFMQRRQRQEQARVSALQQSLQVGDRVVTVSGLYGTIVDKDEATVDLEIAEDVVTTWLRAAIREVRKDETVAEQTPVEEAPADDVTDAAPADAAEEHGAEPPSVEHIDPDKD